MIKQCYSISIWMLISFLCLLSLINVDAMCSRQEQKKHQIKREEFDKCVDKYLKLMNLNKSIETEGCAKMVRLYNTIIFDSIGIKTQKHIDFEKIFYSNYTLRVAKCLDAQIGIGMSFYSKKYDIYIGGGKHTNSIYEVID